MKIENVQHTPGPWTIRACGKGYAIDYNDDQEQVVDYVYELADARLIAAAPVMLKALKAARAMWGDYLPPGRSNAMTAMREVDEAIALATLDTDL